jgi:hypothetical protein
VGACRGVEYFVSITRDDGRNDFQVKLKARNSNDYQIATRFEALLTADTGETARREGGSRIHPQREAQDLSYRLGAPFQTPVNRALPVQVRRLQLTLVETANVEVLPSYATDSTYLDDFRDFPKTQCSNLAADFQPSANARFIGLTETCYNRLPTWTAVCQQAVEEILKTAATSSPSAIPCLKEWRNFQQCYSVYAYGPNPDPKPDCNSKVPACTLPQ